MRPYPIVQIAPREIILGKRLRKPERDVTDLVESIARHGLINPLWVRTPDGGRYELIAGYHRLKAVRQLQWDAVPVYIFTGDDLHAELMQIDENLIRVELSVADRCKHLARRKEIYEALFPSTRHGGDRKRGGQVVNLATRFSADTADRTGLSERTVQREVEIGSNIVPDVLDAVADSPLADQKGALLELSKLDDGDQRAVVGIMDRARQDVRDAADRRLAQHALVKKIKAEIQARRDAQRGGAMPAADPRMMLIEKVTRAVNGVADALSIDELPGLAAHLRVLADQLETLHRNGVAV